MSTSAPPSIRPRKTWSIHELPALSVDREITPAIDDLDPSRLAILVGAGVSIAPPTRLPSAQVFLRYFYDLCLPESCDRELFVAAVPDLRFEAVIGIVQERFDPDLRILDLYSGGVPNRNHFCLAELARRGALIITTNFDTLIETAHGDAGSLAVRLQPQDFETSGKAGDGSEIWHLHGAVVNPQTGVDTRESITASIRDCWRSRELFEVSQAKGAALSRALAERDLLVVGYSGADDYDIAPALEKSASRQRVIWVQHTPQDSDSFLADGVTPLWRDFLPDGTTWYRAPCASSLATMISSGNRSADHVKLLACETGELLDRLTGLEAVGVTDGEANESPEAQDLHAYFAGWRERHLGSVLSSHLLALLLCRLAGLGDESRRLLAECGSPLKNLDISGDLDSRELVETIRVSVEIQALTLEESPEESAPAVLAMEAMQGRWFEELDQPGLKASYLTLRGRALRELGRLEEAIATFRDSLAIRRAEPSIPDLDAAEYDLALALFQRGFASRDLTAAAAQVERTLAVAQGSRNPEGIARAHLLAGRIAEQLGHSTEARKAYAKARTAALRSGLEALIATTAGELGLCLWTEVSTRATENLLLGNGLGFEEIMHLATNMMSGQIPEISGSDRGDAELAAKCLSEAFRVHDRHREANGMVIVGSSLAECLEALGEGRRSLLAHCAVYYSAGGAGHEMAGEALMRVRRGAQRELPELSLEGLDDDAVVTLVQKELLEMGFLI